MRFSIGVRGQCQAERESERRADRVCVRSLSVCRRVRPSGTACVHLSVSGPPHVCVAMGGTNVSRTNVGRGMEAHAFHGPCDCGPSERSFVLLGVCPSASVGASSRGSCARLACVQTETLAYNLLRNSRRGEALRSLYYY